MFPASLSLVLPTLGDADLLSMFFDSLYRTSGTRHEVSVSCFGPFPDVHTFGIRVLLHEEGRDPGVGRMQNAAMEAATGDYIAIMNDDIVFLPDWDDLDGRAKPDRWLGWELLEPFAGSFPPLCEAGRTPSEFRRTAAIVESYGRRKPLAEPALDGGLFLFHRSLLDSGVRYEEGWGNFGGQDTDFMWRMFQSHPYLLYGRLNLCLYHFGGTALSRRPGLRDPESGERFLRNFTDRHGIPPHGAHPAIRERTLRLLEEDPLRWPERP